MRPENSKILSLDQIQCFQNNNMDQAKKAERLYEISNPIVLDLRSAGYEVDTLWDLGARYKRYDSALPILFRHFAMDYPDEILEWVARLLAVPQSLRYREQIIEMLMRSKPESRGFRFGLGLVIARTTRLENLEATVALISNKELGQSSRIAMLQGVKKYRRQAEIGKLLEELKADSELEVELRSWR